MIRRRPLQPIDEWELDMWAAWDRIKAALDKQEKLRAESPTELGMWVGKAAPLWNFITDCDALVRHALPDRCSIAYGYWLTARDIEKWTPPTGGPFFWKAPGQGRVNESKWLAEREAQRVAKKDQMAQQRKDNLKAHRASVRAAAKAARKEKV